MEEFYRSPFLTARAHPGDRIIELVRTSVPFAALCEVVLELEGFLAAVRRSHADSHALVYDCRRAPPAGPEAQRAVERMQEQLNRRFQPLAIVLSAPEAFLRAREDINSSVHYFTNPLGARRAVLHQRAEPRAISTARGLGPGGGSWQPVVVSRAPLRP